MHSTRFQLTAEKNLREVSFLVLKSTSFSPVNFCVSNYSDNQQKLEASKSTESLISWSLFCIFIIYFCRRVKISLIFFFLYRCTANMSFYCLLSPLIKPRWPIFVVVVHIWCHRPRLASLLLCQILICSSSNNLRSTDVTNLCHQAAVWVAEIWLFRKKKILPLVPLCVFIAKTQSLA